MQEQGSEERQRETERKRECVGEEYSICVLEALRDCRNICMVRIGGVEIGINLFSAGLKKYLECHRMLIITRS